MILRYKDIKIQSMPAMISPWSGSAGLRWEGKEGKKKVDEHSDNPVVWLCGIDET